MLVTRDREGRVHALSNVCWRRGMTLVDGAARADLIRCPYHLWAHDLDGRLAAAPFMDGADLTGCDLPRYPAVHQEDMVACERVQAGLRAPDAILGPLLPLEAGVARFRAWVAG